MRIFCVTQNLGLWFGLSPFFSQNGIELEFESDFAVALDLMRREAAHGSAPRAVILDFSGRPRPDCGFGGLCALGPEGLRQAVVEVLKVNPAIETALCSTWPDPELAPALEGLGVLCLLPPEPEFADLERLLLCLRVQGAAQAQA